MHRIFGMCAGAPSNGIENHFHYAGPLDPLQYSVVLVAQGGDKGHQMMHADQRHSEGFRKGGGASWITWWRQVLSIKRRSGAVSFSVLSVLPDICERVWASFHRAAAFVMVHWGGGRLETEKFNIVRRFRARPRTDLVGRLRWRTFMKRSRWVHLRRIVSSGKASQRV